MAEPSGAEPVRRHAAGRHVVRGRVAAQLSVGGDADAMAVEAYVARPADAGPAPAQPHRPGDQRALHRPGRTTIPWPTPTSRSTSRGSDSTRRGRSAAQLHAGPTLEVGRGQEFAVRRTEFLERPTMHVGGAGQHIGGHVVVGAEAGHGVEFLHAAVEPERGEVVAAQERRQRRVDERAGGRPGQQHRAHPVRCEPGPLRGEQHLGDPHHLFEPQRVDQQFGRGARCRPAPCVRSARRRPQGTGARVAASPVPRPRRARPRPARPPPDHRRGRRRDARRPCWSAMRVSTDVTSGAVLVRSTHVVPRSEPGQQTGPGRGELGRAGQHREHHLARRPRPRPGTETTSRRRPGRPPRVRPGRRTRGRRTRRPPAGARPAAPPARPRPRPPVRWPFAGSGPGLRSRAAATISVTAPGPRPRP